MSPYHTDEPEASGSAERPSSGRSNPTPPTNRHGSGGSGGSNFPGGGDAANRIRAFNDADSASAYLWAHQLRHDFAQFVRNNEQTQINLASALGTASNLQKAVDQLKELVQHLHEENQRLFILNQRLMNKQDDLEATVEMHFSLIDSWSLRINSLEERMSGVENFCARAIAKDETDSSIEAAMHERSDEIQMLRRAMEQQREYEEGLDNYSGCSSVESIFGSDQEYHPLLSMSDRATPSINERCTHDNGPSVEPQRQRRTIEIVPVDEEDLDLSN